MTQRTKRTKWVQLDLYDVYAYERHAQLNQGHDHATAQAETREQTQQREALQQQDQTSKGS